ncbi:calcium-binding protein, partial [Microvirga sp. BSC39]|uniref:calcium-binding protein n=1 Tax=Microvirga sp. BSC39 TaxID=1549810 RepID=UPI0013624B9F
STQNTGEAAGDTYEGIEGLAGSNYADHLTGDHADNVIYGGYGSDTLFGLSGNDRLYAGGDNDDLIGGSGADTLDGGDGFDYASYYTAGTGVRASLTSNWLNTGDAAWDVYVSIEGLGGSNYADWLSGNEAANVLHGHGGNDELLGGGGFDELFGGEGWDVLHGGTGADVLDGGAGHDFASYLYATAGVTANLSESWRNQGEAYGDTYVSIEGLAGSDWLTGGNGTDIFRFDGVLGAGNVDVVNDFGFGGPDLLQLTRNTFTAFANQGSVYAAQVALGAAATTAEHRLVYNGSTGALFYDADGAGGAAQVQFATLGKGLAISASSFALLWL